MSALGKQYTVYSVKTTAKRSVWIKAGLAHAQSDGSLNVSLDVLPIGGELHIRETGNSGKVPEAETRATDLCRELMKLHAAGELFAPTDDAMAALKRLREFLAEQAPGVQAPGKAVP